MLKKMKKYKQEIEKTLNNDLFISPTRKNAILELALNSFFVSKHDYQMSKS